jgi:hypothetical protein
MGIGSLHKSIIRRGTPDVFQNFLWHFQFRCVYIAYGNVWDRPNLCRNTPGNALGEFWRLSRNSWRVLESRTARVKFSIHREEPLGTVGSALGILSDDIGY